MEGTAEIIPAEEEEGLRRHRDARLADKGFAPWDEAMMIYSPMTPDLLERKLLSPDSTVDSDGEPEEAVPMTPALLAESRDAFSLSLIHI